MKPFLLFISGCLGLSIAHAQTGSVTGKLTDTLHNKEMALATVSIRKVSDSALVTYRLSTPTGDFKVPGLPLNTPLRIVITFTGYVPYRKEFTLTKEHPLLNLDKIELTITTHQLDEIIIKSEVPPIIMRHDTMEFNADAFKTLPEAALQDLLSKLPGVSIGTDGKLKANGKPVNKIMVEGKVFFGDDPKIAMQQLPANVIEKVQVLDDTDQKEQLNGEHPEQLGKVINIKLKKNVKKGWFGKVHGGVGTDSRYDVGGIVNSFRDTLQVSLLGYSNNVNQAGFSSDDLRSLGGMDRGGNGFMGWGNSQYIGGANIGSNDDGIRKTGTAGVNVNYDLGKLLKINGKYFYVNSNTNSNYVSNSTQTIGDTVLSSHGTGGSVNNDITHALSFKVNGRKDSTWYYNYEPSFGKTSGHDQSSSFNETGSNYAGPLNDQQSSGKSDQSGSSYNHNLNIVHTFRKSRRRISLYQYITTNTNNAVDTSNTISNYYLQHQRSVLDQYKRRDNKSTNLSTSLSYTEPLTKKSRLILTLSSDYAKSNNVLQTFDKDTVSHLYANAFNPAYSNELHRKSVTNQVGLSYHLSIGKLNLGVGGSWASKHTDTDFGSGFNPLSQRINYFVPSLSLYYKRFSVYYSKDVDLPQATDIQPVPDISNPLSVTLGNPLLKPVINHHLYIYDDMNWGANKDNYLGLYSSFSFVNDAVIRTRTVDAQGAQISKPENVDGTWSGNVGANANILLHKDDKLRLFVGGGFQVNAEKKIISVNDERSGEMIYSVMPSASITMNVHDVFEFTPSYQIALNRSQFDNKFYVSQETMVHTASATAVLRLPKNVVWESAWAYRFNNTLGPGIQKTNVLWSASLSYLFGKEHKEQIKFSGFDLLNQHVNLSRSVNENYVSDFQSSVLKRYFMISFIYNIRGFKNKQ